MVTTDVAVAVYLSWVLGFAGILLLPYDISVAVVDPKHLESLDKVWNFVYWRLAMRTVGPDSMIELFDAHNSSFVRALISCESVPFLLIIAALLFWLGWCSHCSWSITTQDTLLSLKRYLSYSC